LVALLLTACDSSTSDGAAANGNAMPGMPGVQQTGQRPEHMAEGTLNSIDPAAGTVNISHGPVASANWPAMTMSFKLAEPNAAADLKPGQRVDFHFTIESGMDATVTQMSPKE
jgi:Cu(I)/Ag(I) efflux system membrane fusion protein